MGKDTIQPALHAPMKLPSQLLAELINSTPTIEAKLDGWRKRPLLPGKLKSIQDGCLWQTLPGPDGGVFFNNTETCTEPDELRIGLTLGQDSFSFSRTVFALKHSTGVLSLNVANLDTHLRCGVLPCSSRG